MQSQKIENFLKPVIRKFLRFIFSKEWERVHNERLDEFLIQHKKDYFHYQDLYTWCKERYQPSENGPRRF